MTHPTTAPTPAEAPSTSGTPMLELTDIHSYYDHIHALKGITLKAHEGEIVALIGGNGAGKTTTLRTVSGMMKPRTGTLSYLGENIAGKPAHQTMQMGMSHVPEGRRIFAQLTVRENLEVGAYTITDKKLIEERVQEGFAYFPRLKERENQLGGTMSGGEQQMLAIARALMVNPRLLLLDEPSMGLSPLFVEAIFDIIVKLNKEHNTTVLLVEQNANMALAIAHRAYVLQTGEMKLSGKASDIAKDESVRKAYLGED
ncbi:ABC transporter ATP-binding protein [Deinococcus marmoris]|uniref:ABC transporter ATP-binding protein n=1 Tax=Deinococcus marmoris TaxID=249408 RepID=UPI0004966193|nr:ABC transporter ATP-binding protein [Deinococcus marmoris]